MFTRLSTSFFSLFIFLTTTALAASSDKAFTLEDATIYSVHQAIQNETLSCQKLVKLYIQHIQRYDLDTQRGAPMNAMVNLNPEIYRQAQLLDHYYKQQGKFVGPLHCIPIIVKDNIDTVETPTSAGTLALLGSQPVQDAFIVSKLRQAGAIILGKSAMNEFASNLSLQSSRSGRVGNAYNPVQTPGGVSAGTAVAISANFAMLGIDTDNEGSLNIPAIYNGVYSLRPSIGRTSQQGVFPHSNIDGVNGLVARNIQDMSVMLSVLAQADSADTKTLHVPRDLPYETTLDKNALEGARIGLVRSIAHRTTFTRLPAEEAPLMDNALQLLTALGVTFIAVDLPQFDLNRKNNNAGDVEDINAYLAAFPSTRKNYTDLCNSGYNLIFQNKTACLKHMHNIVSKNSNHYQQAVAVHTKNRRYIENIMAENHLDTLLIPLTSRVDAATTTINSVAANSGLPALTLLTGYSSDPIPMPAGFELIGKMYGESRLLSMGYSYENAGEIRIPPALSDHIGSTDLLRLSLSQWNNLLTLVGNNMYKHVMLSHNPEILTAAKATQLTQETMVTFLE